MSKPATLRPALPPRHAEKAANLLADLVAIFSPSGQEHAAADFLVGWMAAHGFKARLDEVGNAVGSRGEGPREVLLLGHIDTFPGELPVCWKDGWLYGRGTVDAKGPLCAFAAAAFAAEIPPGWQVTVVGAVEEEAATSRGARHLLAQWPRPAYCVIGEPSGADRVTLGYKGRLIADLNLRLPFAHSAGAAALPAERAVGLWNSVVAWCAAFNAGREAIFERLDPSLRHIRTRDEGAYAAVEMALGFRLPPDLPPEAAANRLRPLLTIDGPAAESRVAFSGGEAAYRAEKNTPLVRAFLAAIREQSLRPRFVLKTGTSDMNVVGPAWGCPVVAYGPGDSTLDHTPDERIHLDEYLMAIAVLRAALERLMEEEAANDESC